MATYVAVYNCRVRLSCAVLLSVLGSAISIPVHAAAATQPAEPVAYWSFEDEASLAARDSVTGITDQVIGHVQRIPGAKGRGLRFDGYTSAVIRSAKAQPISDTRAVGKTDGVPRLGHDFSLGAWVALDAYPWNWLPVIDDDRDDQSGYTFGIDAFGHLGMRMSVNGAWQSVTSARRIPLKRWVHLAVTYSHTDGISVYMNGDEVARLAVAGDPTPAEGIDLIVGRVRHATLPYPSFAIHPLDPVWYSLEGGIDEVGIWSTCLSNQEIKAQIDSTQAPAGDALPWAVLPAGTPGAGRFGAFPCSLSFDPNWDQSRRMGPDADVVVRFDDSPIRLVFWQGTAYEPAWVTENGKWYTDEFLEAYGPPGCTGGEDCEPMSDKQTRYAHVSIVQSTDARAVVHWRYALTETRNYSGSFADPVTGWSDWADEYWTVYPDGVAVRKQILWTTEQAEWAHEWQETIIINGPGQRPEDNINYDALSLANMKGESASYSWAPKTSDAFDLPHGPDALPLPANANIQVVNLKSLSKPFQIVPPQGARILPYNGEKSYSAFEWWNHWPVAQIPSSGRPALDDDRASHSSLSHIYWGEFGHTSTSVSKILLDGLTQKKASDLAPLARSWITPPSIDVSGGGQSEGYDPAQRAFVANSENGRTSPITFIFHASESSPLVNPALVIRGWSSGARVTLDGNEIFRGKRLRIGHERHLDSDDLVIWLELESTKLTRVEILPSNGPSD
jgi:hypothetical protein